MTSTLIVGANRGIGFGLVEQTLVRDKDAIVYATAREPDKAEALQKLSKTYPGRLVILKLDMIDEKSVDDAALELKKHTATLERVIVNAGIILGAGRLDSLSPKDLLANFETNVVGPHIVTKAFVPFLLASKGEHKVLGYVTSFGGSVTLVPANASTIKDLFKIDHFPLSGYCITKAALNMEGRQWADLLEPQGISVPLLHPGIVATEANPGGGISVEESAKGLLDVVDKVKVGDGAKGILSYDGTTAPW